MKTPSLPNPTTTFWTSPAGVLDTAGHEVTPVEFQKRKGWKISDVGSRVKAAVPQLNAPEGSLTWWILPREDFASAVNQPWMSTREPMHPYYFLLVDDPDASDWRDHRFALFYSRSWYQQIVAKWHSGGMYEGHEKCALQENSAFAPGFEKAFVGLGHQNLPCGHWIQLGLSWNESANDYRMYLNGVLVQTATTTIDRPLLREPNSGCVYAGHPLFACGELAVSDRAWGAAEFASAYVAGNHAENRDFDLGLSHMHTGWDLQELDWLPPADWNIKLDLPLTREEDLARFYVQGMTGAPSLTSEGLRVRTSPVHVSGLEKPANWQSEEPFDPTAVYLWLDDDFTGDFAVEYEFKPMQNHGLSLLMVRASGLHGGNFLAKEPRRISGHMRMVCWENVRNYHWEYYRQMEDARNDVASHVLVKNPYLRPLAYQATDAKLAVGEWHRLQFVHEGSRLRGAVDNLRIFDVEDDPFAGFGPVFRTGTLAIRLMWDSDIIFRNLKVWSKAGPCI